MNLMMRRRALLKINNAQKDYSTKYLTFEALEDAITFQFTKAGLSYSLDNGNSWTELSANTNTPAINVGNTISFKGELTPISDSGIGKFSSTGKYNAMGNIMSLLFGDDFEDKTDLTGKDWAFCLLFDNSYGLVNAENMILPAITLIDMCYQNMFKNCRSLVTVPELPAMRLDNSCYAGMFDGCTSLTIAPKLPATTLAGTCYAGMFYNCTGLTTAPELPATTLADVCYMYMFLGCTSLTKAPELPAKTLRISCYNGMFSGCTNLNYIKAMFTTTPSTSYTPSWVQGVASTGTFVKNSAATWNVTGPNGIPSGWTVETASE